MQAMQAPIWPPDDTEESVLGTTLHQGTITNARLGLNEEALALKDAELAELRQQLARDTPRRDP
jgi:hypothetical protein